MHINLTSILLVATAVVHLLIGLYVCRRSPDAAQKRAFGLMTVAISLWTLAVVFAHFGTVGRVWAVRFAFASAGLIPLGFLAFVHSLPSNRANHSKTSSRFLALIAIALVAFSLSPWIVTSVQPNPNGPGSVYGPLHPVYATYMILCFGYSVALLVVKRRVATGRLKLQINYLILAFAIPSGSAMATSLILPLFSKTSGVSRYGPFFSLLLLGLIGHAIIRHRLMDMRVVIRRSVVYLVAFLAAGFTLIALLVLSNLLFHDQQHTPLREIVLALVIAVVFSPLKAQIQRAFDRYLYREPYDYPRTIRDASRALGNTIELPRLLSYITGVIVRTMKCESVAVYLLEEEEAAFELAAQEADGRFPASLALASPLVATMSHGREIVFLDEIVDAPTGPKPQELRTAFSRIGAEVVLPLLEERQVIGLVCIGPKRSGDPYFSNDADLLTTLANQSSVAIRNAQAHQRVVQVNEELQKVLSTIESGVIAVGSKGKIALFNRAAEQLTGMSSQSARGRSVDELPAPLRDLLISTARDGRSRSQEEFVLPDAAGQLVPLVCSTSPLLILRGATVGAVAVLADLSRLKELEQEKRRVERLAALEAIASGMVHEIRNPLVAIKTFSQLLPIRFQDKEFRETFSRVVDREIRRIDDLLTRFRTLSSASSQLMEMVDISKPIEDTIETLRPRLEEHRIQFRRVADGVSRSIRGNTSQLEQLFLNLCLNAIEAMEPGGELTVRVADLSEGGGTTLLVEISDTGCGIPEHLLPTIFNPFVTTKAHGTGLGLAICRSIADAHHAVLSARNNVGRAGTTFTIQFPVPVGVTRATQ